MRFLAPPERRWMWTSTLLLLLIAGWVIRQWPARGLWYDETVNAHFAGQSWAALWEWCTRIDNQMPLHFALLKLWGMAAGTGEFALRFFSVMCGILAAAGVMALGRRLGESAWAGWLAAAALALSQSFLYAAFEVRPYGLLLALLAWSSVVLWEWWSRAVVRGSFHDRASRARLFTYWVLASGMLYTHYTAVFALAAHGVFAAGWTVLRRNRRGMAGLAWLMIGPIAGFALWAVALAGRDVRAGTAYDDHVTPGKALQTYVDFWAHGQRFVPEGAAPYGWAMVTVLVAAVAAWVVLRRRTATAATGTGMMFAASLVVVPLLGLLIMVYAVQGKLSGRHGWMLWVGAAVLLGVGWASIRQAQGLRWPVWIGILGLMWLPATARFQPIYNSYLREAFAYINSNAEEGDVLVLRDGTLFTAASYYGAALPWVGLPGDKLTDVEHPLMFSAAVMTLDQLVRAHDANRVWVLAWQGDVMDPQNLVAGILEEIGQPEPLTGAFGFGDVTITRYRLHDLPESLAHRVGALHEVAQVPPDGPVFLGGYVVGERAVAHGGTVLVHHWWRRGDTVIDDLRISARLYDAAGNFYAPVDGPPVPETLDQAHWVADQPVLGRVMLSIPTEMPIGPAEIRLVIYDMDGSFEPFSVAIDVVDIGE